MPVARRSNLLKMDENDIRQLEELVVCPGSVVARAASALLAFVGDPDVGHAVERTGLRKAEIYNWRKIYMTIEGISGILNRHIGRPRSDLEDQIVAYVAHCQTTLTGKLMRLPGSFKSPPTISTTSSSAMTCHS